MERAFYEGTSDAAEKCEYRIAKGYTVYFSYKLEPARPSGLGFCPARRGGCPAAASCDLLRRRFTLENHG